ncbi:unnamed protein product [Euphydryas editha]|uniref:Uncharacterized protein n=1 Tax=Euphydryas editha TaxID=104508 RepID=A0AAU9U3E5_EUPED|nr:unnamed protein product [Euphydryas editha]
MSGSRKLKIGFLNPGSLGSRHDEFVYAMDKHNVDLMAINETWLKQGEEGRAPHHTKEPTHFTSESETLLDLVCSNAKLDRVWVNYIPDLSHYALITFNINAIKDKIAVKKIVSRDIKNIDQSNLKEAIQTIDWNSVAQITDVDSMVAVFTDSLLWVFDLLAPLKTNVIKQHKYPWITYNVRLMMRERDKAYKISRHTNNRSKIEYYRDMKRQVYHAINREKIA